MRSITANLAKTFGKCAAMGLALTMMTGCGVEVEGEEGNLNFEYLESASAPSSGDLAVGSQVDIEVTDAREDGGDEPLELTDAYSDDAQTLDVVDQSEFQFRLEAHEESGAEGTRIHAEALDDDGEEVSDAASIRTAEVSSVEVSPRCEEGVYATNSNAQFSYEMRDSLDDGLTGYGYYPVSVEPEAGGEIDEDVRRLQRLKVATGDEAGEFEIVPGDEIGGEAAEFELVEPADITDMELQTSDEDITSTIEVGEQDIGAMIALSAGDDTVCGGAEGAVELESTDPDVCEPSYGSILGGLHVVGVEGLEAGTCEIEVSVPDTELEENFTVEIE